MMTPGPITLLATVADAQRAAGMSLAPGAIDAMSALRDLILAQPWARVPHVDALREERDNLIERCAALACERDRLRILLEREGAAGAPPPAPVPNAPRKARSLRGRTIQGFNLAAIEASLAGTCAARDLDDARAWQAQGGELGERGAKLERAILRTAAGCLAYYAAERARPAFVSRTSIESVTLGAGIADRMRAEAAAAEAEAAAAAG